MKRSFLVTFALILTFSCVSFAVGKSDIKSTVITEDNFAGIGNTMQLNLYGMRKDLPIKEIQYFTSYTAIENQRILKSRLAGSNIKPKYIGKTVGWVIEEGRKQDAAGITIYPKKTGKTATTKQTKPASPTTKKPADTKGGVRLVPPPKKIIF